MVTVHSAMNPRGGSAAFALRGDSASVGTAVADFEVSTSFHCNGKRHARRLSFEPMESDRL